MNGHIQPPPNYYSASSDLNNRGLNHPLSVLRPSAQMQHCPYYQLYGPPPSYDSLIQLSGDGAGQPTCVLIPATTSEETQQELSLSQSPSEIPPLDLNRRQNDRADLPSLSDEDQPNSHECEESSQITEQKINRPSTSFSSNASISSSQSLASSSTAVIAIVPTTSSSESQVTHLETKSATQVPSTSSILSANIELVAQTANGEHSAGSLASYCSSSNSGGHEHVAKDTIIVSRTTKDEMSSSV